MSGRAALSSDASTPRLLVLDGPNPVGAARAAHETTDVHGAAGGARAPGAGDALGVPAVPGAPAAGDAPASDAPGMPAAPAAPAAGDAPVEPDGPDAFEVFEVLAMSGSIIRARSAYLFEVGEELHVRIELDGVAREVIARVRAHRGPDDAKITELEIDDPGDPGDPDAPGPPRTGAPDRTDLTTTLDEDE